MIFGKTEHRRTNPYAMLTVGTLAMIGAFSVVRSVKRTARCAADKVSAIFKSKERCGCSFDE